jgi:hypothetical protein
VTRLAYRTYLGDGVYVAFDGYSLVLTTENGVRTTNRIVLEPEVWTQLRVWVERLERGDEDDQ